MHVYPEKYVWVQLLMYISVVIYRMWPIMDEFVMLPSMARHPMECASTDLRIIPGYEILSICVLLYPHWHMLLWQTHKPDKIKKQSCWFFFLLVIIHLSFYVLYLNFKSFPNIFRNIAQAHICIYFNQVIFVHPQKNILALVPWGNYGQK